jgi:hypothetical protein
MQDCACELNRPIALAHTKRGPCSQDPTTPQNEHDCYLGTPENGTGPESVRDPYYILVDACRTVNGIPDLFSVGLSPLR